MESSNSRSVVNNNVVLSSFSGNGRDSGRRSTAQGEIKSIEVTSSEPSNNQTTRSADVSTELTVAPSAVVSGGMATANGGGGGGAAVSPWQRGPVPPPPVGGRGLHRPSGGSCSYGVSSPCCKLLPAATASSSSSSSCHLRSVTLPRGHPAMYSGEVAARLRPPPPPSAAAIRQAAQRASLGAPASKTLDTRSRSHGRAGGGGGAFKTNADSGTEQRRSVSTVIV